MANFKLYIQSLFLFIILIVMLLSPLVSGGYLVEEYILLFLALILVVVLIYVIKHKSTYTSTSGITTEILESQIAWLKNISLVVKILIVGFQTLASILLAIFSLLFVIYINLAVPSDASIVDKILFGFSSAIAIGIYSVAAVLSYLALFFIPFFVSLPFAATIGYHWKKPGRFLLLRPFNRRYASKPLRNIMRNKIAFYGHTYTLADISIKLPWYVRIPVFVGQIGFLQFRVRKIRSNKGLSLLGKEMGNRWKRNLNWCMSWGKVFAIATSDKYWKMCVSQIIPLTDVIFIDLSEMRDNILWEIEECRQLRAIDRVVFLVQENNYSEARKYIDEYIESGAKPVELFQYTGKGEIVGNAFEPALANLLINQ
ncbi:MAG: hypothetical protein ABW080_19695 [Candidatus Thiodiazotropha sp.]